MPARGTILNEVWRNRSYVLGGYSWSFLILEMCINLDFALSSHIYVCIKIEV